MTPRDDEFSEADRGDGAGEAAADAPPRADATDLAGADTLPAPATAALGSGTRPPPATAAGSAPGARADATPGVADDAGATAGPAGLPAPLPAGRAVGRYVLGEVLGEGGMGTVYRARDPELGRDVALKVVASRPGKSRDRLLAEARAMAKLEHPNVLPIYDVGTTDDGIYLVMPLVAGGTLHDWIHARPRPWREVLTRFLAAGRGLAAAHAAGLVHRDFKPRNVLLDGDDVLVADFGLTASDHGAAPAADSGGPAEGSAGLPSTIAGTPAYMAPEQARGEAVDARADQYSFCISLWEGLHGQRPTEADTRTSAARSSARRPAIAGRAGAPDWLRTALVRGFAAAPGDRWPSLAGLLDHLARRARRGTWVPIGAVTGSGVVAIGALLALLSSGGTPTDPCPPPTERLAAAWSPAVRNQVEVAFARVEKPFAAEALERIVPQLDAYASSWATMHVDGCRATHVERQQAIELLDLRMACLDRRLAALSATTHTLVNADSAVASRAIVMVTALPKVEDCANERTLSSAPLPAAEVRRTWIAATERQLAELLVTGGRDPKQYLATAHRLAAQTRLHGYAPLHARALHVLADAMAHGKQSPVVAMQELATLASRMGDDEAASLAWSRIVHALTERGMLSEARQVIAAATAADARAADAPPNSALRVATAYLELESGNRDRAFTLLREALDAASSPIDRQNLLYNLGAAHVNVGAYREARDYLERALTGCRENLGARHPTCADVLQAQAYALMNSGDASDLPAARRAIEEALAIRVGALGESHARVANTLDVMVRMALQVSDFTAAETHARKAITIYEALDVRRNLPGALRTLATALDRQGRTKEAEPHLERAREIALEVYGPESTDVAFIEISIADRAAKRGDCATARRLATHARTVLDRASHPMVISAEYTLAQCDFAANEITSAVRILERALARCDAGGCVTGARENLQFLLGSNLVEKRHDRSRGATLVLDAREGFTKIGNASSISEIDAWLRKHRISRRTPVR